MPNLFLTSNHRVQFILPGQLHQICPIFFQSFIGGFRIITGHPLVASHFLQFLKEAFPLNASSFQPQFSLLGVVGQNPQHHMLHTGVVISHSLGFLLRLIDGPIGFGGKRRLCSSRYFGFFLNSIHQLLFQAFTIHTHPLKNRGNQTLWVGQQSRQKMVRVHRGISILATQIHGLLQSLYGILCHFFRVHFIHRLPYFSTKASSNPKPGISFSK